jgi:hypothetical protein
MRYVPLLIVPFLLYNAFAFLVFSNAEGDFREATMFSVQLISGATLSLTVGATVIILAVLLLGVEVVKATRIGNASVVDHVFATLLFIAALIEFLLVREAATSTFVVLMTIALIDLICGFAISLKSASRDVNFG